MKAASLRAGLQARLHARRAEIEQAVLTRVYAVSGPTEAADPEYVEGLRAAVTAAIDYGLAGIQGTERNPPPTPRALLVQARIAARNGVNLDTVLRRYFAGYALLGDFLLEEAQQEDFLHGEPLKRLLGAQAARFDRLLATVSEEHARESEARSSTAEERRAGLAKQLLAGEQIDMAQLAYDFDAWHVGAVAAGPEVAEAIQNMAQVSDRRLLVIRPEEELAWAWFGGWRKISAGTIIERVGAVQPLDVTLAIGEPAKGLAGWRLTHQQARAALPIAQRNAQSVVRYADVGLVAAILQDDVLVSSLQQLYLAPLALERDGGAAARQTLRAYIAAGRNVSSAAAALGVSRQTVGSRLRAIEERIGRTLDTCAAEIEIALRLEVSDEFAQIAENRLSI